MDVVTVRRDSTVVARYYEAYAQYRLHKKRPSLFYFFFLFEEREKVTSLLVVAKGVILAVLRCYA